MDGLGHLFRSPLALHQDRPNQNMAREPIIEAGGLRVLPLLLRADKTPNVYAGAQMLYYICRDQSGRDEVLKTSILYDLTDYVVLSSDELVCYAGIQTCALLAPYKLDHPGFLDARFFDKVCTLAASGSNNSKLSCFNLMRELSESLEMRERFFMRPVSESRTSR